MRIADDFRPKDVHEAVGDRWYLFFELSGVLDKCAHGFGVTKLADETLLLLGHIYESDNSWVGEEYEFR